MQVRIVSGRLSLDLLKKSGLLQLFKLLRLYFLGPCVQNCKLEYISRNQPLMFTALYLKH